MPLLLISLLALLSIGQAGAERLQIDDPLQIVRAPSAIFYFKTSGDSGKPTRTIGWKPSCANLACVRDFGVLSR